MNELFFEIIHPNHPYYLEKKEWLKACFNDHLDRIKKSDKISLAERIFINKILEDYKKWKTTDQP